MDDNLEVLFRKIITDKKVFDEFIKNKNLDDMYEFAIGVQKGYTVEEFKEFLIKMINLAESKKIKSAINDDKLSNVSAGTSTKNKMTSLALTALMTISSVPNVTYAENTKIDGNPSTMSQKDDTFIAKAKSALLEFYNNHKIPIISSGILLAATIGKLAIDNYRPKYERIIIDCLTPRSRSQNTTLDDWFKKLGGTQSDIDWYSQSLCYSATDEKTLLCDVKRNFGIYSQRVRDVVCRILKPHHENNLDEYTQGMDRVLKVVIDKLLISKNMPIPQKGEHADINISYNEEAKIYYIYKTLVPSILAGRLDVIRADAGERIMEGTARLVDNSQFAEILRRYGHYLFEVAGLYILGGIDHISDYQAVTLFDNIIYDSQMYQNGHFNSNIACEKLLLFSYSLLCNTYHRFPSECTSDFGLIQTLQSSDKSKVAVNSLLQISN